ncbi:hypothetical protein C4J95_0794 [Pseudomonas orientalis]|nr:hypothetical protein C4J96_0784 [Pseudomonas orientalis]AZE98273.1 hypothetical protein C4J95_0794 [Pseudomonas orientalis]
MQWQSNAAPESVGTSLFKKTFLLIRFVNIFQPDEGEYFRKTMLYYRIDESVT